MKLKLILTGAALLLSLVASAQDASQKPANITFDKNKTSYAMGYRLGLQFSTTMESEFELDTNEVIKGIKDASEKKEPAITREEMALNVQGYENKMKLKQYEAFKALAEKNKKRSDDFLKMNRKKKGIKELASGIQYRVIEDGIGNHPTLDSEVTIHYRGSLIGVDDVNNYQEFDSSFVRGEPKTIKVNEVLKGWQEIIPLMRPGGKWQVFIPPELAYGVRGQNPIGPNEILIFDINLLDIK